MARGLRKDYILKKHILVLVSFMSLVAATYANDVFQADQQFSSISQLIDRAERAFESNNREEALRLYGSAMRAYEQFAETFPSFAPDLVRFRIAYCRNQMSRIRQQPAQPDQQLSPPVIAGNVVRALQEGNLDVVRAAHAEKEARGDPAALLILSALHVKEDNLPQARIELDTFLELFPNHAAAHYNMAQLLLREDQPDFAQARKHYQLARDNGAPADEDLEIVIGFE